MRTATYSETRRSVHPHGRGDNAVAGDVLAKAGRFTPTGVGTIASGLPNTTSNPVHPHGRGDNGGDGFVGHEPGGSPPRAWGQ